MQAAIPLETCTVQAGSGDPPGRCILPAVLKAQGSIVQHVADRIWTLLQHVHHACSHMSLWLETDADYRAVSPEINRSAAATFKVQLERGCTCFGACGCQRLSGSHVWLAASMEQLRFLQRQAVKCEVLLTQAQA